MSYVSRRTWKNKSSGFGYAGNRKNRFARFILFVLFLFVFYELVTSMFLVSYRVESMSMEPTVPAGGIIFATPLSFGPEVPFTNINLPGWKKPARGDLVINKPAFYKEQPWHIKTAEAVTAFFTLQKKSLIKGENWSGSMTLKRIIGLPGDTVKMINFEIFIKPQGNEFFFSEKDIMQVEYSFIKGILPEGISDDFPLTGNMNEITLGEDEYFLAGDNRAMSNDSYYWGPSKRADIKARVLLEYSPEIKILQ